MLQLTAFAKVAVFHCRLTSVLQRVITNQDEKSAAKTNVVAIESMDLVTRHQERLRKQVFRYLPVAHNIQSQRKQILRREPSNVVQFLRIHPELI